MYVCSNDMKMYRSNPALHGHDSRKIGGQRMILYKAAEPLINLLQAIARCPSSRRCVQSFLPSGFLGP
jgi:hypothetical protein